MNDFFSNMYSNLYKIFTNDFGKNWRKELWSGKKKRVEKFMLYCFIPFTISIISHYCSINISKNKIRIATCEVTAFVTTKTIVFRMKGSVFDQGS